MYIRLPKHRNILRVPHNFLTLDQITDSGDLVFSLLYHINQSDVVKYGASQCRITAISRVIKSRHVVYDNPWEGIDNTSLIKGILGLTANARASIKNQEQYVVGVARVDNTSVVNNELVGQLRNGVPIGTLSQFNKTSLAVRTIRELNMENNVHPILQVNPEPPPTNDYRPPARHVFQTNLIRRAIDPSHIHDFEDETLTPEESIRGVYRKNANRHIRNNHIPRHLGELFREITYVHENPGTVSTVNYPEDTKILTFVTEVTDEADVYSTLVLPDAKARDENKNYKDIYVQFDLLNSAGAVIQTHQERVNVLEHVEIYHTPKLAPIVKLAKFDTMTKGNIKVQQVDPSAKGIRLMRKNFSYAVNDMDSYSFVNDYPLSGSNGLVNIPVDVSARNTTIYRTIPIGQHDTLGSEFTNVVIKPSGVHKKITAVSLSTKVVNLGIDIEIREVPADVVSLRVKRRDTTLHETSYSIIGDDSIQVNPHDESAIYVVIDNDLKMQHVYEYVCDLIYRNGTITQSGNAIVEYQPLVENLVDTKIDDLVVSYDINNLDVKFKLTTVVHETNLDTVKNLLQRQGIEQHFIDELTSERNKLRQLLAHSIHRVDLTSGERENFGTITTEEFSDAQFRAINAVKPLQVGHKYRYEVVALLRSAETLLEDFVKNATDENTKKTYVYQPNKFLHPVTLQFGNISSVQSRLAHYPKDQMAFGNIGNLAEIDVSFASDTTFILEATAEEFDREHLLIKWKINGEPGNIDHFIVLKEHLGQRKIVGKSHANFDRQTFTYVYTRGSFDVGELFFVITPVYNTYSVGASVKTNGIVLEE